MTKSKTNKIGKDLAAILSAGIGTFLLGLLVFLAEMSSTIKDILTFYPPSGSLSGISRMAVIGWLVSWVVLCFIWRNYEPDFKSVFIIGVVLIGLGLLFMFPPFFALFN